MLCRCCNSAKVALIWRIETTLATLVITIIASNSAKLAKVSCPIENENDLIRRTIAAKAMGCWNRLGKCAFTGRNIRRKAPKGNIPSLDPAA